MAELCQTCDEPAKRQCTSSPYYIPREKVDAVIAQRLEEQGIDASSFFEQKK